jgi:O-antigen/teichoic acid export membrane protein
MLVYAGADLLGSSIGLILSPIFTRLFSPEQYGAQAALTAIWGFIGIAQYGGMDSAYSFFRASNSDAQFRRGLLVTASFVAVVAALLVTSAVCSVSVLTNWVTNFSGVSQSEAASFSLTLISGSIMGWFLYVLRFERRATAFARVSLMGRVGGAVFVIPALMMTTSENRLVVGFLVTGCIALIAAAFGWRELTKAELSPFVPKLFKRSDAEAMLRYGLVLVPASGIYAASTVVDRLLVTWFSGPTETAVLALALRLGAVGAMLRTWFALVWDSQLTDWIASLSREALQQKLKAAAELIAHVAAMLVGFSAVWTQPVVQWLYPNAYWAAVPLVPWIVLGVAISGLSIVGVAAIIIAQRPKLYLPVYSIGLLANVAVGLWAVPRFGASGAVAGALGGEMCILCAWIYIGTRYLRNVSVQWIRRIVPIAASGAFVALYQPGLILKNALFIERLIVSVALLVIFGLPVACRAWQSRKQDNN